MSDVFKFKYYIKLVKYNNKRILEYINNEIL